MGRKKVDEGERKKRRVLYLTDAEWEELQKAAVQWPGVYRQVSGLAKKPISTFDPDAEGV